MTQEFRASVKRLHLLIVHFQTVVATRELRLLGCFFDGVACLPLLKAAGEELARYFGGKIIHKRFNNNPGAKQTSLVYSSSL